MPPIFTQSLAQRLDAKCKLKVQEAADGMALNPNEVLIAPGGKHMKVASGIVPAQKIVRVTDDPPENSCRPSVDYLFPFPGGTLRQYGRRRNYDRHGVRWHCRHYNS